MQVRKKPKKVVILALDINDLDPRAELYHKKKAKEKIQRIEKRIDTFCQTKPNCQIVVGWREYGITGGKSHRAVTKRTVKKLNQAMQGLIRKYPNLIILSGAMSVFKHKSDKVLDQLSTSYKTNKALNFVRNFEDELYKTKAIEDKQVEWHEKKVRKLQKKPSANGVYVISNEAHFFCKNKQLRHAKMAPFKETEQKALMRKVFQPPKEIHSFFPASNHLGRIDIQVGICREHVLDIKPKDGARQDLYVLMSDTIEFSFKNFWAQYAIHFDRIAGPRLSKADPLMTKNSILPSQIELYTSNLLEDEATFCGPFKPISVFAARILAKLDNLINEYKTNKIKRPILELIREKFSKKTSSSDEKLCQVLRKLLSEHEAKLLSTRTSFTLFSIFKLNIPSSELDDGMEQSIDKMKRLIKKQKVSLHQEKQAHKKMTYSI